MRKMGLEPTRHRCHKILSLARLPVPTLPQLILSPALSRADLCILSKVQHVVKSFFKFYQFLSPPGKSNTPVMPAWHRRGVTTKDILFKDISAQNPPYKEACHTDILGSYRSSYGQEPSPVSALPHLPPLHSHQWCRQDLKPS